MLQFVFSLSNAFHTPDSSKRFNKPLFESRLIPATTMRQLINRRNKFRCIISNAKAEFDFCRRRGDKSYRNVRVQISEIFNNCSTRSRSSHKNSLWLPIVRKIRVWSRLKLNTEWDGEREIAENTLESLSRREAESKKSRQEQLGVSRGNVNIQWPNYGQPLSIRVEVWFVVQNKREEFAKKVLRTGIQNEQQQRPLRVVDLELHLFES